MNPHFDASVIMKDSLPSKASLTFALPSVGASDSLSSVKGVSVGLTAEIISSPLSLFNTAVRGQEARFHGITGCKVAEFNHHKKSMEVVDAFSTPRSSPKRPAVADVVAGAFNGESLIVSASANSKYALSGSVSHHVANMIKNSASVVIGSGFAASSSSKFSAQSNSAVANALLSGAVTVEQINALSASISATESTITVDGKVISRADEGVNTLLAELAYAKKVAAQLTTSLQSLVSDNAPDAFTFAFSALKTISAENRAALLSVVDVVIADVTAAFAAAYDNRVIATTLLLGSPITFSQSEQQAALAQLKTAAMELHSGHVESASNGLIGMGNPMKKEVSIISEAFPLVFVTPADHVCNRANVDSKEANSGFVYSCSERMDRDGFVSGVFLETQSMLGDPAAVTVDDIRRYQIVLWLVLGLAAVVYYAVYSTAAMTIIQDPALFGNLSPTWTKRR